MYVNKMYRNKYAQSWKPYVLICSLQNDHISKADSPIICRRLLYHLPLTGFLLRYCIHYASLTFQYDINQKKWWFIWNRCPVCGLSTELCFFFFNINWSIKKKEIKHDHTQVFHALCQKGFKGMQTIALSIHPFSQGVTKVHFIFLQQLAGWGTWGCHIILKVWITCKGEALLAVH